MPEEKRKKTVFSFGKGRKRRRQQLCKARAAQMKQTSEFLAESVSDPVSTTSIDSPGSVVSESDKSDTQQSIVSLSPLLLNI